jgi:hypothetical protein
MRPEPTPHCDLTTFSAAAVSDSYSVCSIPLHSIPILAFSRRSQLLAATIAAHQRWHRTWSLGCGKGLNDRAVCTHCRLAFSRFGRPPHHLDCAVPVTACRAGTRRTAVYWRRREWGFSADSGIWDDSVKAWPSVAIASSAGPCPRGPQVQVPFGTCRRVR